MSKANGLKGVRPSIEVIQEFSNKCSELGAAIYRLEEFPHVIEAIKKRVRELDIEIAESRKQEQELAKKAEDDTKKTEAALSVVQQ